MSRRGEHYLHDEEDEDLCVGHPCRQIWRAVECDGDRDVLECATCGKVRTAACSFDDEYA